MSEVRRVGVAADHAGFELKLRVVDRLKADGYEVLDFGAHENDPDDDYPDRIVPLARAVAAGEVDRGGTTTAGDQITSWGPPATDGRPRWCQAS